ncbi:MAG: LPS assembly protein LptD [Pseudomonadota bacterium]
MRRNERREERMGAMVQLRCTAALAFAAVVCAFSFGFPAASLAEPAGAQVFTQTNSDLIRRSLNINEGEEETPAVLEADEIFYDSAAEKVIASGDVKIFYAGRVLEANKVIYDSKADEVTAMGNVRLINTDGSVLTADNATFDTELRNGLIKGAKAVLADGQARMAAVEGRRVDGRFTALSKVVYSPCEVCEENPNPLWQIRARKIVQDEEAKDIIYEDATFEVLGMPVGWLPYFRHADPSVKRRTGFLTPSFLSNNNLGYVVKVPYYLEIAPNQDITIIPWIVTDDRPVLESEYRLKLNSGDLRVAGGATWSEDDLERGFRGYFDGEGDFAIGDTFVGDDFFVGFDANLASDDTFLRRYDISGTDRLETRLYVESFNRDGMTSLEAIRYQSFRDDEPAGTIPLILPHLEVERFFDVDAVPGRFNFTTDSLYLRRTDDGQDVARLSSELGWSDYRATSAGITFDSFATFRGDLYRTFDGEQDDKWEARALPSAGFTIGYPLGRATENASHIVEPLASVIVAPYGGNPQEIPNEDSLNTELDELSIFEGNRFPGIDRWEDGPRATVGAKYTRRPNNGGAEFDVAFGQSYRLRDSTVFSEGSGLEDTTSDFVGAWRLENPELFYIGHRFRVTNEADLERNEVYANATLFDRLSLGGSYVYLEEDPEEGADDDRSEGNVNGSFRITDYWRLTGNARRDFEESRFVTTGAGLIYADECCEIGFTVRRRFNDVEDAPPTTTFGFVVKLRGLGTSE